MIQTVKPGDLPPARYLAHVTAICDLLRHEIEEKGESDPFIVVASIEKGFTMPVMGIAQLPFKVGMLAVTQFARTMEAEFIMIARTTIAANAGTKEQAEAYAAKYNRPEEVPGAQLVAFVSLETYDGVYVGIKAVETTEGKSTVGPITLGLVDAGAMPTLNLLPPRGPLQ